MKSTTEQKAFLRSENENRTRADRRQQMLRLGVTLALMVATVASAQSYRVLKSFNSYDGRNPQPGLVLDGGTLYGTTMAGGNSYDGTNFGFGTVFEINTDGSSFSVLRSFALGSNGYYPNTRLVLADTTLYGTTHGNGGVVFMLGVNGGGYTVLKRFNGDSDGAYPTGGLMLSGSTLYGTTEGNTTGVSGTIFKINTDGTGYTVLKVLSSPADGATPKTGVVLSGTTLYGTTYMGGSSNCGNLFRINTDGSGFSVLKNFNLTDGAAPWGELLVVGDTLVGTTAGGGALNLGTVFKINTDGTGYAVLKSFTGSDGAHPFAGLVLSGSTLYGTTSSGGSSNDGVVFKMNTDGSGFAVLKNFTGRDGMQPYAGLVLSGSTLYGTTYYGGDHDYGVVFSLEWLSITTTPLSQTAEAGTMVWFKAEAEGVVPGLAYQWFFDGTNSLAGATNASLELPNVQPAQAGAYTVVVTSMGLAVTSAPALLSVIPPVDRRFVPALHFTGSSGTLLHLEYADNLAAPQWSPLSDVTLSGGSQTSFDLSQPLPAQRFYRAWQTNGPPPTLDATMATQIPLTGAVGSSVRVDYIKQFGPTDAWVTLNTVTLTNTTQLYYDLTAFGQPTRLYRVVALP